MSSLVDTDSDVVEMYVKVKVARLVGEMDLVKKKNTEKIGVSFGRRWRPNC